MTDQLLKMFAVRRIRSRIVSSVRSNWIFYTIVLVYIIVLSTVTILKNDALLTSGFDLGIFNQAFHTTLFDGKLFYETGDLSFNPGGSFFGVHFSPILFLLLPFYAIYPGVEILLVMQTVILAFGAFPVYWMSRDKLGKEAGLMISLIYLVYPPLILLNLNDFHLEAFTATFFIFSIYYFEQEEWMKFSALLVLAMLTAEFAPIIGLFMALYGLLLWSKKKFEDRKAALKYIALTVLVSVLIFVLAFRAKESFNASTSPLPSPFHYILSDPAGMLNVISSDWQPKMFYVINFLAPLASLPLLAPEPLIMAFPWIFASFSSTYKLHYSVYFQYTGFVIPFVFVALPKAIERLHLQNARKILSVILLCTVIFSLYLPAGQGSPWNYQLPITNERGELVQKVLPLIPLGASVLTQNDIFPHVSSRAEAYMYLPNSTNVSVDYILVDVASEFYSWIQPDIFGKRVPPSSYTEEVLKNGTFGTLASAKSALLLKRGYTGKPALFVPYVSSFNYENLTLGKGSVIWDPTSTSRRVFHFNSTEDAPEGLWYGPYTDLLPGLYKVTYVVKVDDASRLNQSRHLLTLDVAISSAKDFLAKPYVYSVNVPLGVWFNVTLLLGLPTPAQNVEFRGHAVGGSENKSVYLDYLVVEQLSPQPIACTEWAFNPLSPEELRVDETIISNVTDDAIMHSRGSGIWWYGPYLRLPKGNYAAKFWLRLDKPYDGPLINIDVTSNLSTELLGRLTVYGSNFTAVDRWQSFEVKFASRDDSSKVEFRGVILREDAPVSFLFVEVYTDTEGLL